MLRVPAILHSCCVHVRVVTRSPHLFNYLSSFMPSGNKLRSTEECLMRKAVQADEEYTLLKLNDQNMKDNVSITQAYLNTWKTKPNMEITQTFYRKNLWAKSPPYLGFLWAIFILRQKVLLSPSETAWSKPEIMRSTAKGQK